MVQLLVPMEGRNPFGVAQYRQGEKIKNMLHGRLDYLSSSKSKRNRLEEKSFAIHW